MPRTLPWLTGNDNNNNSGRVKRESASRRRQVKHEAPSNDDDGKGKFLQETPSSSGKRNILRSSQSPPTSSIQRCPSEEFLIEGFDNDDIYIMVEDEFYAIAQTFTQHLHYAEYTRRKKEAKLQNAATINDISRPTGGKTSMTEETRKRKESEVLADRQRTGLDQVTGSKRPHVDSENETDNVEDDDAADDLWIGTSLGGLMLSPRKARSLVGLQGVKSSTRAAAGFSQTSNSSKNGVGGAGFLIRRQDNHEKEEARPIQVDDAETASEEDDDLDIPTNNRHAPFSRHTTRQRPRGPRLDSPTSKRSISVSRQSTTQTPQRSQPLNIERDAPVLQAGSRTDLSAVEPETKKTPMINPKRPRDRTSSFFRLKRNTPLDEFDDLSTHSNAKFSRKDNTNRGSLSLRKTKTVEKEPQDDSPASKKARLNEVPMFLV